MTTIDVASIRPELEILAVGGEGTVYRMRSHPDLVFKEYKSAQRPHLHVAALSQLLEFPQRMPDAERSWLLSRTIWPLAMVTERGHVCGFTMPAIDRRYYRRYGLRVSPHEVLCDWNQIVYHGSFKGDHLVSEIPTTSTTDLLRLLLDLARTVELLHRQGLVIGDLSGKNLVWSVRPTEVVVIDCDSFHFEGERGVCPYKESPGWVDPTLQGAPTNQHSDVYKLGVAAYRALWRAPAGEVTAAVVRSAPSLDVPPSAKDLIIASVGPSGRPSATDWVSILDRCLRFGGRPTINAGQHPAPAAASAMSPPIRVGERPRLNLGGS